MSYVSLSLKTAARLALVLLVVGGALLPAAPGMAASMRGQDFRFGNGAPPRFNIDPDPCGTDDQRMRGRRSGCPGGPPRFQQRGHDGPRGPGSSAFGLQFDNDGY